MTHIFYFYIYQVLLYVFKEFWGYKKLIEIRTDQIFGDFLASESYQPLETEYFICSMIERNSPTPSM